MLPYVYTAKNNNVKNKKTWINSNYWRNWKISNSGVTPKVKHKQSYFWIYFYL